MTDLPRATGVPSRAATRLIEEIIAFAVEPATDNLDANLKRASDLLHIYNAARDALDVGLSVINDGPGKPGYPNAGYHTIANATGIHWTAVKRRIKEGRETRARWEAA